MARSEKTQRVIRALLENFGIIVLLVVVAVFAKGAWGLYQKSIYARESRERAEQELAQLKEREGALRTELERLETHRGIEEEIRHQFDVGREGEHMIVLVDAPEAQPVSAPLEPSLWERIVEFFGFR